MFRSPHRSSRVSALALAVALLTMGTACGDDSGAADDGRLVVAAAFFPLEEVVRRVGGESVEVVTLVPPGEEAHEYEPTAKQLTALAEADVVVYLGNDFQPGVEKAISSLPDSVRRVDLLQTLTLLPVGEEMGHRDEEEDHGHEGDDPHVWLDPANMAAMAEVVAAEIASAQPDLADTARAAAAAYAEELDTLAADFTAGLASCESRLVVTGHHAFGYLAEAFDLTQVSIAGISPSEEPSAATLEDVAAFAAENGVTTIFFEENLPPDLSRTVADEIGATTAVLDPVESLSNEQLDAGATYISVMRENLTRLQEGLRCT